MRMRVRRAAFTLIELMFVLVILGVLLTVAIPKMSGSNEHAALQTTARDIARLAAYGRQAAVSYQREVRLVLATEERQWWLEIPEEDEDLDDRADRRRRDRRALSNEEETHDLHHKLRFDKIVASGNSSTDRSVIITFRPNGTSSGATIQLVSDRGGRMTVEIEAATGRAAAYEGEPKTFAAKLEELGADVSAFPGVEPTGRGGVSSEREPGAGFSRTAGRSSDENVAAYSDAAARLFGKVRNQVERERAAGNTGALPAGSPGGTP